VKVCVSIVIEVGERELFLKLGPTRQEGHRGIAGVCARGVRG
jgi:hypothetical protein